VTEEAIDEIDVRILKRLLKNSRTGFTEIAKECNVTPATIRNRYNQLKKAGIITGSTVITNAVESGIKGDASLAIDVNYQQVDSFIKDIRGTTGFLCLRSRLTENYNVICRSPLKTLGEVEEVKETLKHHSAVIDIRTSIWIYMKVIPDNLSVQPVKQQVP
jgi:DNA-binding Lrp family transcriptional regulator